MGKSGYSNFNVVGLFLSDFGAVVLSMSGRLIVFIILGLVFCFQGLQAATD